jgi:hypothetical protein
MAFLKHLEQSDLLVSGQRNLDVYLVAVLAALTTTRSACPTLMNFRFVVAMREFYHPIQRVLVAMTASVHSEPARKVYIPRQSDARYPGPSAVITLQNGHPVSREIDTARCPKIPARGFGHSWPVCCPTFACSCQGGAFALHLEI